MSLLDDLRDYLTAGLPSGTTVDVNFLPDSPDQIVVASQSGGTDLQFDGAAITAKVHLRSRGSPDDDPGAELLALAAHDVLLKATGSFTMGSTYVIYAQPTAGPPSYLERDANQRTVYLAEYEFCVGASS